MYRDKPGAEQNFIKKLENVIAKLGTNDERPFSSKVFTNNFLNNSYVNQNFKSEKPLDLSMEKKGTFGFKRNHAFYLPDVCNVVCIDSGNTSPSTDSIPDLSPLKNQINDDDLTLCGPSTFQNSCLRKLNVQKDGDPRPISQTQEFETNSVCYIRDTDKGTDSRYKNCEPIRSLKCFDCGEDFLTFSNLTSHMVKSGHYGNLIQSTKSGSRPGSSDQGYHLESIHSLKNVKRPRSKDSSVEMKALETLQKKKYCVSPHYRVRPYHYPPGNSPSQLSNTYQWHNDPDHSRKEFNTSHFPHLIFVPWFSLNTKQSHFLPIYNTTSPTCFSEFDSINLPLRFKNYSNTNFSNVREIMNTSQFDKFENIHKSSCSPLQKLEGMVYGKLNPSSTLCKSFTIR